MKRLPNWEADLAAFVQENMSRLFEWGEWDCALWAASACKVVTGFDPAAEFRGKYSDQRGAQEALRSIGKGTLLKTYQHLMTEKPPAFAQRGDLIWNGRAIGVCMGADALFISDGGLVKVPRSLWKRAFEVAE